MTITILWTTGNERDPPHRSGRGFQNGYPVWKDERAGRDYDNKGRRGRHGGRDYDE